MYFLVGGVRGQGPPVWGCMGRVPGVLVIADKTKEGRAKCYK